MKLNQLRLAVGLVLATSAFAVPSALADNVILPDGSVYQGAADGTYHLIPDVTTANALHVDWNDLTVADALPGPAGDAVPAAQARTTLGVVPTRAVAVTPANGNDVLLPDGSVYQLGDDGSYRLIPDVATANAMHLDWNSLQAADSLPGPAGNPFPSVAG